MKIGLWSGAVLTIFGISGMIAAISMGNVDLFLLILIPVIVIRGPLGAISLIALMVGIAVILISRFNLGFAEKGKRSCSPPETEKAREKTYKTRSGGVIFIGPFPIAFGSFERIPKRSLFIFGLSILMVIITLNILIISVVLLLS